MAHDTTIDAVRLALRVQELRAQVASTNVANASTPGAHALRLDFGAAQRALADAVRDPASTAASIAEAQSLLADATPASTQETIVLDAATRNIAGANVPLAPGQAATQWQVSSTASDFGQLLVGDAALTQQPVDTRTVHDPASPSADANGDVHYAATDLVGEMTTMVTASRGYEANVRAFNILRGMLLRALEIGAK